MDVKRTFRNLVTNQYMPDFDYQGTNFQFLTLFNKSGYSYCCCSCGVEHEYLEYIRDDGSIYENLYEKVLQNILDGKCEHTNDRPVEYLKVTSVSGLDIAAVVGTEQVIKDHLNSVQSRGSTSTTQIFKLNVYELATIKKNYQPLDSFYKSMVPAYGTRCAGISHVLTANRENKNLPKIQLERLPMLHYFIRIKNDEQFKKVLTIKVEHAEIEKTFQLIYKHNLCEIRDSMSEYHKKLIRHGVCILPTYCTESAIVFDQPDMLLGILDNLSSYGGIQANMKQKLAETCHVLGRRECEKVLYQNGFPLLKEMQAYQKTTKLLTLLIDFYPEAKDEILDKLSKLPDVCKAMNIADEWSNMNLFQQYIIGFKHNLDSGIVKTMIELGAYVNTYPSVLELLLQLRYDFNKLELRKTLELFLNENLDPYLNRTAVELGLNLDKTLFKWKVKFTTDICGQYVMDGKEHFLYGYDDAGSHHFNFVTPLLLESGFHCTRDILLEALTAPLHQAERLYIQNCLDNPRTLKLTCRDVLRKHYKGREIHSFVEKSTTIPRQIKDFILMKSMLRNLVHKDFERDLPSTVNL